MSACERGGSSPALPLLPCPSSPLHAGTWGCASGCCSQVVLAVPADSGNPPPRHGRPCQRHGVGCSQADGSAELC